VRKDIGFRSWYYLRIGWSTYFAFIFAAINTLTVTYYLAIENYSFLKNVFPSFELYVLAITIIGIPILTFAGYAHYKKTKAFRSEADVWIESNPYPARWLVNTEMILELNLKLTEAVLKLLKNEELTDDQIKELSEMQQQFSNHIKTRTIDNEKDKELFPR
jgi:hypothetical protein